MDRCGVEAGGIVGPEPEYCGSRDPELVQYWAPRANAHRGVVTWSPREHIIARVFMSSAPLPA